MEQKNQLSTTNPTKNPLNPVVATVKTKTRKQRSDKGKARLILKESIQPKGEIDHFTKTPEAKALMTAHKRHSPNKTGRNQYTNIINNFVPYPLKYAIADALLKDNKTIQYVIDYTGLSKETVCRLKKGEIKLLSSVADKVKEHEAENLVMLGNSILDRISEKDIEKASLLQKTTSYCQLLDKRRLLDGESTENVNYLGKLDVLVNGSAKANVMLSKLESIDNK